jgi:hypothetical protein
MMYVGISFFSLMAIEYMICNLDGKVHSNSQSWTDVTDQIEFESKTLFESRANSLSQIAHLLQQPLLFRLRQNIEALKNIEALSSAPAAQPRATFFKMARSWLKICIFISLCDSAIDKWYLKNSMMLQEHMAAVDAQEEHSKRSKATDNELCNQTCFSASDPIMPSSPENHHQHAVFPDPREPVSVKLNLCTPDSSSESASGSASAVAPVDSNTIHDRFLSNTDVATGSAHGAPSCLLLSGSDVKSHEEVKTSANASGSAEVDRKIIATELRMRRPREPWTFLWGNLHTSKTQQVSCVCNRAIVHL